MRLQPGLQAPGCAARHVGSRFAGPGLACIGAGHGGRQTHQRAVGIAKQRNIGDRQRAYGLAVVAAGQTHETVLGRLPLVAPVMRTHLQRDFGGRSAVAAVERMTQAGQAGQALGQLDHGSVGETGQHHMIKLAQLLGQRRPDMRMRMTEQIDPPGTDAVQIATALGIHQPGTAGMVDGNRRRGFVPLHLGTRVPDMAHAAAGKTVFHQKLLRRITRLVKTQAQRGLACTGGRAMQFAMRKPRCDGRGRIRDQLAADAPRPLRPSLRIKVISASTSGLPVTSSLSP